MANQVEKLNGIAIASIEKINGLTDAEIEKINGLEFTGSTPHQTITFSTQTTGGSAIDGGNGFNTDKTEGSSIAYDPDTDQFIISFSDGAAATAPTIRIGTVSGTTLTFGDKIQVSANTNGVTQTGCHYDTQNDRLIVVYRSPYSPYWTEAGIFARAFELNSSRGVDTSGSIATVFNHSSGTGGVPGMYTEIQDHDGVVDILYEDGSDSNHNYINTVRVTNASTCALTVGSDAEFDTDSNHHFAIAYSPDVDRNVILYPDGNTMKARAVEHLSGNAAIGNEYSYGLLNCTLAAAYDHGGHSMIYDTEHNKFHFLYRYEGSSGGNATHDNYYIGNLTCGGSGNLVITFGDTSGTSMNNTVEIDDLIYSGINTSNVGGAGLIYSHARQRIIMHGSDSSSSSGYNKKFHVIDYNGSAYTKTSSVTAINTQSGAPWDTGSIRTDASADFGTVNLMSFFLYGGSNDGKTIVVGVDAGDGTIS